MLTVLRILAAKIRGMFSHRSEDEEFSDEIREHLDMLTEENVRRGMSLAMARREARIRLGGAVQLRETHREMTGVQFIESLLQDVRYATRMLRKSAGFTAVAALTLALGIGANTAIFSAVNPILFEPLPYSHPGRIMTIWGIFRGARSKVTFYNYRELLERNRSFDALAIFEPWQPSMTGPNEPERLDGQNVTYGYFHALGVEPAMGRDFQPADDGYHAAHVAILSYGLWQRRFGGDTSIVGRQIALDGDSYTVIGVMPRGFDNVLSPTTEIWSPDQYNAANITDTDTAEWGNHCSLVARLKPGVSFAQAKADIQRIAQTPVPEFPRPKWANLHLGFIVDSLQADITRNVKPALLAVLGAVMLVLLIACVNVTNLLLARGAQRRGEFALRAALGAGRGRMARQLLTESVLLAIVGGFFGMAVAQLGIKALIALSPPDLPRLSAIGLDRNVFLFALGITTVIGLMIGLIPALRASRTDLNVGLKEGARQTAGSHQLTRRVLVIAEVALALVLLVSAGLLLRSLERLFAVDPGFEATNVLTMQVQTSGHKFDDSSPTGNRERFFAAALENVRHIPGIDAAGFTSLLPLTDDTQFGVYGAQFEKDQKSYGAFRYVVTPGYFETMRIPLRRGRYLEKSDVAGSPHAVVISESLAREEFGNGNPLGQRAHVGGFPNWPWYTVVGVVADVKQASLAISDPEAVYLTTQQSWFADDVMSLVVRGRGDVALLTPEIKKAIWSVDKDQPITRIATMDGLAAATEAVRRFALILFEAFGLVALALAAVGIYGVLSGSVAERTREIGIRLALGAAPTNILRLVMRQGLSLTGLGVAIGIGGALAASQAIASQLFGISPLDVLTYAGVIVLLGVTAVVACWIPARRAMRVDPMVTLRYE
jgi:putative ABC transport system permease protein